MAGTSDGLAWLVHTLGATTTAAAAALLAAALAFLATWRGKRRSRHLDAARRIDDALSDVRTHLRGYDLYTPDRRRLNAIDGALDQADRPARRLDCPTLRRELRDARSQLRTIRHAQQTLAALGSAAAERDLVALERDRIHDVRHSFWRSLRDAWEELDTERCANAHPQRPARNQGQPRPPGQRPPQERRCTMHTPTPAHATMTIRERGMVYEAADIPDGLTLREWHNRQQTRRRPTLRRRIASALRWPR